MKSVTNQSGGQCTGISLEAEPDSGRLLCGPQPLLSHCALSARPYFWHLHHCLLEINPCMIIQKIQNFNSLRMRTCSMGEA